MQFTYPLGLHKRTLKLQEKPSALKENFQYFRIWNFFTFFLFCGFFPLPGSEQLKLMRIGIRNPGYSDIYLLVKSKLYFHTDAMLVLHVAF